ncbi:hypothetical protein FPHYL_4878 [Fusarium phyllophilum]|uniref:RRM domain-containing protein n=1 Tax=Fusarium phyllophilum TaxID=47803 RepID=A0A8H5K171_9HYPO|nr:hypothetical protein FPHYL_4878 [Fusarium phyllophilum]
MGWCWVQFQRKEDGQRAKEVLNGTIVYGRRIKTGSITQQPGPKPQKDSRGNGTSKSLPSRPATRATSKSLLPVSAAPTSFTIETSSSTVRLEHGISSQTMQAEFQAQGYSQYLHPGRPTTKPRDSDIRGIPKINDVFDTDNPVKSSTNIFMTGMIASGLAVKVMPGEELVRTLPSKGLVDLTIPMTEEGKQQVQQEKGPKYY